MLKKFEAFGRAHFEMQRQFDEGLVIRGAYSLDAIWRAAGSPPHLTPEFWLNVLAPAFTQGVQDYIVRLNLFLRPAEQQTDPCPAYTTSAAWYYPFEEDRVGDTIEPGDWMGHTWLAVAYAACLDGDETIWSKPGL